MDHAGIVRKAAPGELPANLWETGVQAVAGRDDAVLLIWMGGACDDRAIVTIDQDAERFRATIKTPRFIGGCTAVGILRGVLLMLSEPVGPDAFEVR